MADYITLLGAENVQNAAGTMRGAADTFSSAASSLTYALEQHSRVMQDLVYELQAQRERHEAADRPVD